MKRHIRRILRWLPATLALVALIAPWIGTWPAFFSPFSFGPESSRSSGIGWMCVAFGIVLVLVLPDFLRLRGVSRRLKGVVLGGSLGFALVVALAFEPSAGGYVALGLTAQLAAAITWSERCHAMLGGRPWQRIAWALVGVLVPLSVLAAPVAAMMYAYRRGYPPMPMAYPVIFGVSVLLLLIAAIHHLRARNRAAEWRQGRETGEYPSLPQPPSSEAR